MSKASATDEEGKQIYQILQGSSKPKSDDRYYNLKAAMELKGSVYSMYLNLCTFLKFITLILYNTFPEVSYE